jgi:hypothetical protein
MPLYCSWGRGGQPKPWVDPGTHLSCLPGSGAHPPVCVAWHRKQQRPLAESLCSHQNHHPSCDCHKHQAQIVPPRPVGLAQGNSPRSHPCRGYRRVGLGPTCAQEVQGTPRASPERVVTLHHEAAESLVVPAAQGGRCLGRALDLTHYMSCPLEALLAHKLSARWEGTRLSSPTSHFQWMSGVWERDPGDSGTDRLVDSYLPSP